MTDTIPVISGMTLFTSKLIEQLRSGPVGKTLTLSELSAACGRDVNVGEPGYGNLQSAIRHVVRNYGFVWKLVRSAGMIKCLDAGEVLADGKGDLESIGRRSRKAMRKLQTVKETDLKNGDLIEFHSLVAQHGTLSMFASASATKALAARKANEAPNFQALLEMFK